MATTDATKTHFAIDARASRFTVQAFATGLLAAVGHNPTIGIRTFSGVVDFNSEATEGSGFRVIIQANSLSVVDDMSDKDVREIERLMKDEVLETTKYPEIVYESANVKAVRLDDCLFSVELDGSLTCRDVTRKHPVNARVAAFGEMMRASGDFSLKQSDYGIKPISVAGGALRLKDHLKVSFAIVVRKQD